MPGSPEAIYEFTQDSSTADVGVARINLATGTCEQLFRESAAYRDPLYYTDVSADQRSLAYVREDASHPADVWVTGPGFRNPRRVTHVNPLADRYVMGTSRIVGWRTSNGETLRGTLILPPAHPPDKPVPLIVRIYPGVENAEASVHRYGIQEQGASPFENMQLLATRGYAVLYPSSRLRVGTPLRDLADAVLPALDTLVALGVADSNRLGVWGHSFGGYAVLALLTQTSRFRAAVSSAGMSDLFAFYGQMSRSGSAWGIDWTEIGSGRLGTTPWEGHDIFLSNSPFFALDRVNTPLLIDHGVLDAAVPVWMAEQTFVALRRLGKKVAYARYDNEEHWQGQWSYANQKDNWERVLTWFDSYMHQ